MNFDFTKMVGNTATVMKEAATTSVATKVVAKEQVITDHGNVTSIENIKKKAPTAQPTPAPAQVANVDVNGEVVRLSNNMEKIKSYLNTQFLEREDEIEMLSVALVSGTNAFLHGRPGTGKSDLVEKFSNCFNGSNYFRLLMSKTTEPSEVFGPVSINALKNDNYKVVTDNRLPQAHIGFLDEVFKANSAILNGMLTIMNEKLFFNDTVEEVPLISLVGASNEFPEEEGLSALYDRFLLRWNVEAIKDPNNRVNLFKNFINSRNGNSSLSPKGNLSSIAPSMSFNDLKLMNELAKMVKFDNGIVLEYNKLFTSLEKEGILVSDRRKNEALKTVQAHAVMDGRLDADLSDFAPLVYCFWEELDEIDVIKSIIQKMCNPDEEFINNYGRSLKDYKTSIDQFLEENKDKEDFKVTKAVKITEMLSSIKFAIQKIDEKKASVSNSNSIERLNKLGTGYAEFLDKLTNLLLN